MRVRRTDNDSMLQASHLEWATERLFIRADAAASAYTAPSPADEPQSLGVRQHQHILVTVPALVTWLCNRDCFRNPSAMTVLRQEWILDTGCV